LVIGVDIDPKRTKMAIKTMQQAINDQESYKILQEQVRKSEDDPDINMDEIG
jgi:hypothetical protein